MLFNSGTDSIIADIDFLCDTNSVSYPIADKTRNANRWAYKATIAQIKGSHRWQADDSNFTTLPWLTTTLVADQADYTLPADLLRIERVEVMDAAGNYKKLEPFDARDVKGSYDEFEETSGSPKYYDLVGNTVVLKPAPAAADVTTALGLKVHILREIDIFTTGDTTQQPGFSEPFHRIVSYGASFDYLVARGDYEKANAYRQELEVMLKEFSDFTAHAQEEHTRIRPAHRTTNYL
jgi:hypothetical protein